MKPAITIEFFESEIGIVGIDQLSGRRKKTEVMDVSLDGTSNLLASWDSLGVLVRARLNSNGASNDTPNTDLGKSTTVGKSRGRSESVSSTTSDTN